MTEVMSTNPASDSMLSPKATDSAPDLSKSSLPNPQVHRRRRSWTRSSSRSRSRSRSYSRRRYRRSRSRDYSRSSRNLHFSRNGRIPYGRSPPPRSRLSGRPRDRSPRRHSSRSPSHHRYQSGPRSANRPAVAPPNAGDRWPDGSSGGGGPLDYPGMPNRDRSSLHFGNRTPPHRNRTPSYHSVVGEKSSSPTVPTLDERFRELVETVSRRKPEYGVPGGFAHLVLSNRPRMPLPTLLRQAREISVVIERQLPSEIANPRATIVFDLDIRRAALVLPRSPNEGSRPIFDRPEIPNYDKPEYLNEITRRLSAVLSAKASRGIPYTKPYNNRDVGNVEYRSRGSGYSRPVFVGPADVPKGPSYFLHDDRDGAQPFRSRFRGNSGYSRTDWRQTSDKDYYGARYRARNRSRYSPDVENGSPQRQRRRPQAGGGAFEDSRWTHDKYLELEHEDADRRPPDSYSPSSPTLSISERTKDDKSQLPGEEGASSTTPKGREGAKMETEAPSSDD